MKIDYTKKNFPSSARFLRVTGEDGIFFIAVNRPSQVRDIVNRYTADGFSVEPVRRDTVPPCVFRYFDVPGFDAAKDATWYGGTEFYF